MASVITKLESLDRVALAGAAAAGIVTLGALWTVSDKQAWAAYGSGGTPPTWAGYWRITKLRFLSLFYQTNLKDFTTLSTSGPSFLPQLPRRAGSRPLTTHWFLPQRQAPHTIPPGVSRKVQSMCYEYANKHPDMLKLELSKTEGESAEAIYARPALPGRNPAAVDPVLGNEIAHVHPAEDSLHVFLSEADCRQVVEKGWGLLFPLATMGIVHKGFAFVYAPRSEEELQVVDHIVRAAIAHVTGAKPDEL